MLLQMGRISKTNRYVLKELYFHRAQKLWKFIRK
jgi:hypothetical protein